MSSARSEAELQQLARAFASASLDLYALLSIPAAANEREIHRAWRRRNLQLHPDKTRDAFDAAAYAQNEEARDVLVNVAARKAYDDAMEAAVQQRREREKMDAAQRRMVEELEKREKAARGERVVGKYESRETAAERTLKAQLMERGRRVIAERERRLQEADRARQRAEEMREQDQRQRQKEEEDKDHDAQIAELERRIAESKARKEARRAARKGRKSAADPAILGDGMDANEPSTQNKSQSSNTHMQTKIPPPPPGWTLGRGSDKKHTIDDWDATMARLRALGAKQRAENPERFAQSSMQEEEIELGDGRMIMVPKFSFSYTAAMAKKGGQEQEGG